VELLAQGRMAEVFAYGDGRVVKLDRPEWSGVSVFESDVLVRLAAAGLPVARSYGVVTIDDRCGVVLDRIAGPSLADLLAGATPAEAEGMAARFADLGTTINGTPGVGLPPLVERLGAELAQSGLPTDEQAGLADLLAGLDDGRRGICHFDLHPENVLVGPDGWVVIDWLTVAEGPPLADLARTLVLWGRRTDTPVVEFMRFLRRRGTEQRGADDARLDRWVRVVAGARLAEGFGGEYAGWLRRVSRGDEVLSRLRHDD
jgi:aminoglycoside phosphotransferase (APT) family kinase protein